MDDKNLHNMMKELMGGLGGAGKKGAKGGKHQGMPDLDELLGGLGGMGGDHGDDIEDNDHDALNDKSAQFDRYFDDQDGATGPSDEAVDEMMEAREIRNVVPGMESKHAET